MQHSLIQFERNEKGRRQLNREITYSTIVTWTLFNVSTKFDIVPQLLWNWCCQHLSLAICIERGKDGNR